MGITRRGFLEVGAGATGLSFLSLSAGMSPLFAQAAAESELAGRNDHALVVLELAGGNDGLNTVIPFEDEIYRRSRKTLRIAPESVVKIGDSLGLHPALSPLAELYKDGRMTIVQGVGYPQPDRSHFRSMEIWHTASTDKRPPDAGWLGRYLETIPASKTMESLAGLGLTGAAPPALRAAGITVPVVRELDALSGMGEGNAGAAAFGRKLIEAEKSDAAGPLGFMRRQMAAVYRTADRLKEATAKYKSTVEYPGNELGNQLRRAAQVLGGDLGVRVVYASQDGYDTHSGQADSHTALLTDLAAGLAAFDRDLQALKIADKVVVLIFSEFGRRVEENASGGTDHGAASCLFLQGAALKGGLLGKYPSLEKLDDGDLIHTTDFRQVYATLLEHWLGCPAGKILGQKFPALELFRNPA